MRSSIGLKVRHPELILSKGAQNLSAMPPSPGYHVRYRAVTWKTVPAPKFPPEDVVPYQAVLFLFCSKAP
jgi:hypothetical protein